MNGADKLCDVLLTNGVDVCFANPGTSEMHFVAALDRKPQMRCVLGLSETVVTGAADGYARMTGKPAATLLHLGPGLANGLANLHNARRARTPVINVVGDHAGYHLANDAPLTSDIGSLAAPMSHWVGRAESADEVRATTEGAYTAAIMKRGVATMILPADAAWGAVAPETLAPVELPPREQVHPDLLRQAAAVLRSGKRIALILSGRAMRVDAMEIAGRIASASGATLFSQVSDRMQRGAGRVHATPIPYNVDLAVETLRQFECAICLGGAQPVAFFAYPGKPGAFLPPSCEVVELASHHHDLALALQMLADEAGIAVSQPVARSRFTQKDITMPGGVLDADAVNAVVARLLPENAIIANEAITSGGMLDQLAPGLHPHDQIQLTGGAIGGGIPMAAGAAIACPDRKVVALQADGSGMYSVQGLWTQAREQLDVVTIVYANHSYAILQSEMRNVGIEKAGRNATRMLSLAEPKIDWCKLARGLGVEAARCETVSGFEDTLKASLARRGPFLIEANIG